MPNWCMNSVTFRGPRHKIQDFESFLEKNEGKDWFDFFIQPPQEVIDDGSARYAWNIENYGCKWNCDVLDGWQVDQATDEISFSFDSPWAPPIELYTMIHQSGEFEIHANYHEEGMAFVGEFVDGIDDQYEYQDLDDLDDIPEHIVEYWNLRQLLEDRMDMDNYDVDDDDDDSSTDETTTADDVDAYKLPPHTD